MRALPELWRNTRRGRTGRDSRVRALRVPERFLFFGFLFVTGDRSKVRKLELVVGGEVRGRVRRVGRARVAQVVRDALPLEAHPPAGADPFVACGLRPRAVVLSHGVRGKFACAPASKKCAVNSSTFKNYAVLSFQNFLKENIIPRGSRIRTEAHRNVKCSLKVGNTPWSHGSTAAHSTQLDIFDKKLPVRRENIFSCRGATCEQRVTTYKISSRRDDLKSEETRDRR